MDKFTAKMIIKILRRFVFLAVFLFLCAGRLNYWQGWFFIIAFLLNFVLYYILIQKKPGFLDLMKERMKPGGKARWWDKLILNLYIVTFLIVFVISSLDAGRFGWSGTLSWYHYLFGWFLYLLSTIIIYWAMFTNKFFSSIVRIQSDRGHHLIQEGPYRFVRHPGYVGAILHGFAISLILGSYWGLLPAFIQMLLFTIRTYLEDQTLQKELFGYSDYCNKVKYRLLPKIW